MRIYITAIRPYLSLEKVRTTKIEAKFALVSINLQPDIWNAVWGISSCKNGIIVGGYIGNEAQIISSETPSIDSQAGYGVWCLEKRPLWILPNSNY